MIDPDMPAQQLRLRMGELTASEMLVARAAIRWANSAREERGAENGTRAQETGAGRAVLEAFQQIREHVDAGWETNNGMADRSFERIDEIAFDAIEALRNMEELEK